MFSSLSRRTFFERAVAVAVLASRRAQAADDLKAIQTEIEKRHDESVHRLQDRIRQPSIAAENRGMTEGCDLMMRLLRDAGFDKVTKVPTDGHPARRRNADLRHLFHVRREAGRSSGVVFAAV
jgi:hypothetical protein